MRHVLTIKFFLKEEKNSDCKIPRKLFLRITVNRKKVELILRHSILPNHWDEQKERTKNDRNLNEELSFIEYKIFDIKRKFEFEEKNYTAHDIKNTFLGKELKVSPSLLEYFNGYLARCTENSQEYSKVVIGKLKNTFNKVERYIISQNKKDIELDQINYKWLKGFDHFLMTNKDNPLNKPLCRNTTNKLHDWLRMVLLSAVRDGYIHRNPYSELILRDTPTVREFLIQTEIDLIKNHPLAENKSLDRVRDIFLFSIYTGLRFSDAISLKPSDLFRETDGRIWINKIQEKTNERVMIPVLKTAEQIILKYQSKQPDTVLPTISNQKLNAYLKAIGDLTGIQKRLTHHIARHTFATTITLSNEIPIEIVSKWLGHKSIRTTQIYAKVTSHYLGAIANRLDLKIY